MALVAVRLPTIGSLPMALPQRPEQVLQDKARALAQDLAGRVKRSDRYLRWRVGIVGTWAVLSLVTLWASCPSTGPTNPLGADVQVLKDSVLGAQQILIRNESGEAWTEVVVTLDDAWRHAQRTVRAQDRLVLSPSQFRRGLEPAPRDLKPRTLLLECEQGRARFDLR